MKKIYTLTALIFLLLGSCLPDLHAEFREPELKSLDSYSRLVFPLNNNGSFKIQGKALNGSSVKLSLEHVKVEAWSELSTLQDQRVAFVNASPMGLENAELEIKFKQANTEYFAYLQPSPPAVIVDIWPKGGHSTSAPKMLAATPKAKEKTVAVKAAAPKNLAKASKPLRRSLASIVDSVVHKPVPPTLHLEKDFFQRFILPMPSFEAKGEKFSSPPRTDLENHWEFGKAAKDRRDELSLTYKFAIKLFKEGKFGLCVKSLEIMERDFPHSPYQNEQTFLKALAFKRLGEVHSKPNVVAKAETTLRELMIKLDENGHNLPYSPTIRLYFTSKSYRDHQWIEAVEEFEYVVKLLGPNDPDYPIISLALADAYHAVGQNRRAERIYRFVAEHQKGKTLGREALYRIGDILALEGNHSRAIEEIQRALATYPEYASTRSESHFNLGEAYFWLGNYGKARQAFEEFIKRNPSQTIAALAHARLGEIAELTKRPSDEARKHYLAAINTYPYSPGATMATLRLGRINLADETDIDYHMHTLQEILKKPDTQREVHQMARLLLIQTQRFTRNTEGALVESLHAMSDNTGSPYLIYKDQYIQSQGEHLAKLLEEKKYSEVLVHYDKNKKWLEMYGAPVFQMLAEAYRGLGLYDVSNQYMNQFAQAEAKEKGNAGRQLASIVKPAELQNYFAQGNYREVLRSIPGEPETLEEIQMAMVSHFKLEHFKEAYHLADLLKEHSSELGDVATVDTIEVLTHRSFADKNFSAMESEIGQARHKLKEPNERLDYLFADSIWYQRRHEAAISAYTQALERFPKSERAERSKYNLAMSYVEVGKRKDGVKLLTELRDHGQNIWSASAKQELELLAWESKYSTILRGLPPSGLGIAH